ncbi:MAG: MFS transporter [Actinobacteria bacterium]|nr:MFS transporter [Actinomycetota bacterium]
MFPIDRRTKMLTLGAMCFALFMAMLDNTVVNVALPRISQDLGSGISGLQWIIDAYTLTFATLMLTGGTLGDIMGRKRFFQVGLLVFTGGSLLCALAPSLGVLIAGRGIQGLGAALLMPGTLAILTNTFLDPRERAQAIGIWAGISGLALAMGPVVGGLLVDSFGWQSVFYLNVPIGIVALVVSAFAVRESKSPEGRHLDVPGQILAIIAMGALTYALIEANNWGWTSPLIIALFVVTAIGGALFILVERRSSSPMLQLSFFRNATFTAGASTAAIVSFGMFGMFFFLTLFFQNIQGYTPLQAGVRALPMTLMIIIFAPLAGRLVGRIGSKIPMAVGLSLNAISLFLFTRVQVDTGYGAIWPLLSLAGFGMAMVMTPMTAAVMSTVPPQRAGMASATTSASREIGGVFGIALLGAIVTHIFTGDVSRLVDELGLPPAIKATILEQVSRGAEQAGGAGANLPAGGNLQALAQGLKSSFVSGMHVALIVAGAALVLGAVVAAVFVRGGRPHSVAADASGVAPANASSADPVPVIVAEELPVREG